MTAKKDGGVIKKRLCGKCGKEIKRGQEWIKAWNLYFHFECPKEKKKVKK